MKKKLEKSKNFKTPYRSRVRAGQPKFRIVLCLNLRNRRIELGLTQKEVGEAVGVVQQWIGQLESPAGDEVPSLYQLEDLAKALKCLMHDLLIPGRFTKAGASIYDDMRKFQQVTRPNADRGR